jgi:hypothetical protein
MWTSAPGELAHPEKRGNRHSHLIADGRISIVVIVGGELGMFQHLRITWLQK